MSHDTFFIYLNNNIDVIKVLASAYEFKENANIRKGDDEALKRIDNAIVDELENRFSEKFQRSDDVSLYIYIKKIIII